MAKLFTVTIGAAWLDKEETVELSKSWKEKYKIDATFIDGGDYYSKWKLSGKVEDVKRCIVDEWCMGSNVNFNDIITDKDKLETLIHA